MLALIANKALSGEVSSSKLAVRKSRGGKAGMQFSFAPRAVTLGLDEDDELMSNLVLDFNEMPDAAPTPDQEGAWTQSLALLRRIMMALLASAGEMIRPDADGPEVRAIRESVARDEFYRQYLADTQDAKSKAFRRAVKAAQAKGLIVVREIDGRIFLWLATV